MVISAIMGIITIFAIYGASAYSTRTRRQQCRGNLQMIALAVQEYAIDYLLANGATVTVSQLHPRYLAKPSSGTCPSSTGVTYGTQFIIGTIPRCPVNEQGHAWSPTDKPGM
ncbi:hypothetical protein GX586_06835 [bacterium]|nr:hypothetical protein [bacterium]